MPTQNPAWWCFWPYCVLAVMLMVASYTDVRRGRVYNWTTFPGILIGLIGHTVTGGLAGDGRLELGLAGSAAGLAVGFVPLMLVFVAGGIGGGDAKLMGAIGALTGWRFTLAAMLYGFAVGLVMALVVMVVRGVTRETLGRVWRFLVLLLVPGGAVDPASEHSPRIPYGLAFCIGAGIALVEVLWRGPVASRLLLGFGW